MSGSVRRRRAAVVLVLATAFALAVAGCSSSGGDSSSSSTGSASSAADPLGTPNAATGTPVTFGLLNLQSGPVTFPEVAQAEQAAAQYVNNYLGGIGGHPIKIVTCATDGQPSTSQKCANQIVDDKPVAILGGADTGAPGAIPVWNRAKLAYLGGIPFTPVESNNPSGVIFSCVSTCDNAAAAVYAAKTLGAKSAAVIYTSDTQGTATAVGTIIPAFNGAGLTKITKVAIPPTSSDVSSAVATAVGAKPDVIYVDAPAACPNILASLKQLGNTAKIMGVDPCTSPPAIAGAKGGANGLYFASPVLDPNAGTDQSKTYLAAIAKYAPKTIALDSLSTIGFQTVMNVATQLKDFTTADLTTSKILSAFTTGTDLPNFMGHTYTCDKTQVPKQTSVCNPYQQIRQVQNAKIVVAQQEFINPYATS